METLSEKSNQEASEGRSDEYTWVQRNHSCKSSTTLNNETETMREAPIILPVFTTSVPLDFPTEGTFAFN